MVLRVKTDYGKISLISVRNGFKYREIRLSFAADFDSFVKVYILTTYEISDRSVGL